MQQASLCPRYRRQAYGLLIAALVACILINYHNLFRWFWHDELTSLRHFQLVPLVTTITDYTDVNNHVGFNLLCNLYLKLTGQQDFLALVCHPARLRILLLLITCGTVWALWRLSLEVGGLRLALINLVLLLTTVPFYNFSMQLRSYGLGMLLVLLWMRYLYRYYLDGGWKNGLGIALFPILLLYIQPANVFLIAALYPAVAVLAMLRRNHNKAAALRLMLHLWMAITAGVVLGLALYLPMLKDLLFNPWARPAQARHPLEFLRSVFGLNAYFLIAARYVALLSGMAGLALYAKKNRAALKEPEFVFFIFCLVLYTGAYLVAFLLQGAVFVRIFMPCIGLFIMAWGLTVNWLMERLNVRYRNLMLVIFCGSCLVTFPAQIYRRNQLVAHYNREGIYINDLYCGYFMYQYEPFQLIRLIRERSAEPHFLLFSMTMGWHDATDVLDYLHIPYYLESSPDRVARLTAGHDHWYLIAMAQPRHLQELYPSWHFEKVNSGDAFNNLYRITPR